MRRSIDVIVPVYAGLEEVQRCLNSVIASKQRHSYHLLIINDASPDPDIHDFLRWFAKSHSQVILLENERNLGFVATVNRGMSLHSDTDVVLLNSDTEVANDWLDRLAAAAYRNAETGTVTPFSNNATICSFPLFCQSNSLPPHWSVEALDRLFARCNQGEVVEIPTGVGFCQYIRRDCLQDVGLFDVRRFGRGYGEENDFCRRAVAKGWRNLLCCDTFVYHEGGVSFSSEQDERIQNAQIILDRLYPDYHRLIQRHIAENPAEIHRVRVLLEMLRQSPRKKVLFLTHHLGGGTWKHIRELAGYLGAEMDVLVIRPAEEGGIFLWLGTVEDVTKIHFALPEMYPQLLQLLRYVGVCKIHFHHTLALETSVWGLPHDLGLPFDITLHDYYFFNANPTQTDGKGFYRKAFALQQGSYDLPVSVEQWQQNQLPLLRSASQVIAPSRFAADLFREVFPDVQYRVAPHPDSEGAHYPDVWARGTKGQVMRVLVTGALSLEKGADVLEAVANAARKAAMPLEFHLLGYAYRPLSRAVIEHGAYDETELEAAVAGIDPHLVWFPAVWPETYSYTLSEVMRLGLPVVVPDIGAFPERVQDRPLSWVVPWEWSVDQHLAHFRELADVFARFPLAGEAHGWQQSRSGTLFYRDEYLRECGSVPECGETVLTLDWLEALLCLSREKHDAVRALSKKEELLLRLVDLRQGVIGRLASRLVPIGVQRMLKRKLSRAPIHEIRNAARRGKSDP